MSSGWLVCSFEKAAITEYEDVGPLAPKIMPTRSERAESLLLATEEGTWSIA